VVAAALLALCIAAPELGGVAAAATSSSSSSPAAGSASEPTHVVLVARRRSRSQVERARFRAYLKRHPNILKRKIAKHPNLLVRRLRHKAARRAQAKNQRKRRAYVGARAHKKKNAAAKQKRRRRAAVAGAAGAGAARRNRSGRNISRNRSNGSADSLGWTDWVAIGLLALAPFAAVALLLYITDLRRRPRAPSRSKRRRSLVITPHKT
jgi:hypothetical protein